MTNELTSQDMQIQKIIVEFLGKTTTILSSELKKEIIDIDFNGEMLVQFKKDGKYYVATNAIDGWGMNIAKVVKGKKLWVDVVGSKPEAEEITNDN